MPNGTEILAGRLRMTEVRKRRRMQDEHFGFGMPHHLQPKPECEPCYVRLMVSLCVMAGHLADYWTPAPTPKGFGVTAGPLFGREDDGVAHERIIGRLFR